MRKRFIRYALVLMAPLVLGAAFIITPRAAGPNLQVVGGGTLGRLTKWTGFTSGNSVIGNTTVFEDKFGMVGIGTDSPSSKLTVQGLIESTGTGGVKFPDGTIQTTAGAASNQVVNSLNGLTGQVMLAAGSNITITPNGDTLTIASSIQDPALSAFQAGISVSFTDGDENASDDMVVPANKRLVIEYVTVRARSSGFITLCSLRTSVNGTELHHNIIPLFVGNEFGPNEFRTDKMVRLYADGGTNITLAATRTVPSGVGSVTFSLSGYLVDLP